MKDLAKTYNKTYNGFYVEVFNVEKGFYETHTKSNGTKIYKTFGSAVNAAKRLGNTILTEIKGYNPETETIDTLTW